MFNRDVEELYPLIPWGTMVRIVENGKMFPEALKPVKLQKKSSGQRVVYVQSRLKELGLVFDIADGRFGNMTELAVKYFQVWHNLEPTGAVDEDTYRALGMIK
jgi:peptidoglycan hydrolase-like protein with peptidoglycan-binding domain